VTAAMACTWACRNAHAPGCTCACEGEGHGQAHNLPVQQRLPLAADVELAGPEERRVAPGPLQVAEERPAPRADVPRCTGCGRTEAEAGRLARYPAGDVCRDCAAARLELVER
jgi:hypothetical protein